MEFVGGIAAEATKGSIVRISSGLFQPIAADDVALAAPRNGTVEIRPGTSTVQRNRRPLSEGGRRPASVVSDPEARYFGGRSSETASCVASNRARSEVSIRVVLQLSEGYLNGRLAVPIEAHDT
jgi:hypothetical protein